MVIDSNSRVCNFYFYHNKKVIMDETQRRVDAICFQIENGSTLPAMTGLGITFNQFYQITSSLVKSFENKKGILSKILTEQFISDLKVLLIKPTGK